MVCWWKSASNSPLRVILCYCGCRKGTKADFTIFNCFSGNWIEVWNTCWPNYASVVEGMINNLLISHLAQRLPSSCWERCCWAFSSCLRQSVYYAGFFANPVWATDLNLKRTVSMAFGDVNSSSTLQSKLEWWSKRVVLPGLSRFFDRRTRK